MEPEDGPMSRVGRTFWNFWNYITETVNRLLRPEPPVAETNNTQDAQDAPRNDERTATRDGPAQEEKVVAASATSSIMRPVVSWDSGSDLQAEITEGQIDETGIDVLNVPNTDENREERSHTNDLIPISHRDDREDTTTVEIDHSDEHEGVKEVSDGMEETRNRMENTVEEESEKYDEDMTIINEEMDDEDKDEPLVSLVLETGNSSNPDDAALFQQSGQIEHYEDENTQSDEKTVVQGNQGIEENITLPQAEVSMAHESETVEQCVGSEDGENNITIVDIKPENVIRKSSNVVQNQENVVEMPLSKVKENIGLESLATPLVVTENNEKESDIAEKYDENEKDAVKQLSFMVLETENQEDVTLFQQSGSSSHYEDEKTQRDDGTAMQRNQGRVPEPEFPKLVEQCVESEGGEHDNGNIQEIIHENETDVRKSSNEDEKQGNVVEDSINVVKENIDLEKLATPLVVVTENREENEEDAEKQLSFMVLETENQEDETLFQQSGSSEHYEDVKTQRDERTEMQRNQGRVPQAEFPKLIEQCIESEDGEHDNGNIQEIIPENETDDVRKSSDEDEKQENVVEVSLNEVKGNIDLENLATPLVAVTENSEENEEDTEKQLSFFVLETENQEDVALFQQSGSSEHYEDEKTQRDDETEMQRNQGTVPQAAISRPHESEKVERCVESKEGEHDNGKMGDIIHENEADNVRKSSNEDENQENVVEVSLNVVKENKGLENVPTPLVVVTENSEENQEDREEQLSFVVLETENKEDEELFQQSGSSEHYKDEKTEREGGTVVQNIQGTVHNADPSKSDISERIESEDVEKGYGKMTEDVEISETYHENITATIGKSTNQESVDETYLNIERENIDVEKMLQSHLFSDTENNEEESELKKDECDDGTVMQMDQEMKENLSLLHAEYSMFDDEEDEKDNDVMKEDTEIQEMLHANIAVDVRKTFDVNVEEEELMTPLFKDEDKEKEGELKKDESEDEPLLSMGLETENMRDQDDVDGKMQRDFGIVMQRNQGIEESLTVHHADLLDQPLLSLVLDTENMGSQTDITLFQQSGSSEHYEDEKTQRDDGTLMQRNQEIDEKLILPYNELSDSERLEKDNEIMTKDVEILEINPENLTQSLLDDENQQNIEHIYLNVEREITDVDKKLAMDTKNTVEESELHNRESGDWSYQGMEQNLSLLQAEFSVSHESGRIEQCVESGDAKKDNEIMTEDVEITETNSENVTAMSKKSLHDDHNQQNLEQIFLNVEKDVDKKLPTHLVMDTENTEESSDWTVMETYQGMEQNLSLPQAEFSVSHESDRIEQCVKSGEAKEDNEIMTEDVQIPEINPENVTQSLLDDGNQQNIEQILLNVESEITDVGIKLSSPLDMDTENTKKESVLHNKESSDWSVMETYPGMGQNLSLHQAECVESGEAEKDNEIMTEDVEIPEINPENVTAKSRKFLHEDENQKSIDEIILDVEREITDVDEKLPSRLVLDAKNTEEESELHNRESGDWSYQGMEQNLSFPHVEFSVSHESGRIEQRVESGDAKKDNEIMTEDVEITETNPGNVTAKSRKSLHDDDNQQNVEQIFLNVEKDVDKKLPTHLIMDTENTEESGDWTVMETYQGMEQNLSLPHAEYSVSHESGKIEQCVESGEAKKDNEIMTEDVEIPEINPGNVTQSLLDDRNQQNIEQIFLNVEREITDVDKKLQTHLVMDTENTEEESEVHNKESGDWSVMETFQGMEQNLSEISGFHESERIEQAVESGDAKKDNEIMTEDVEIPEINPENVTAKSRESLQDDENHQNIEEILLNVEKKMTDVDKKLETPLVMDTVNTEEDGELHNKERSDWTLMETYHGMEQNSVSHESERIKQCVESGDAKKDIEISTEDANVGEISQNVNRALAKQSSCSVDITYINEEITDTSKEDVMDITIWDYQPQSEHQTVQIKDSRESSEGHKPDDGIEKVSTLDEGIIDETIIDAEESDNTGNEECTGANLDKPEVSSEVDGFLGKHCVTIIHEGGSAREEGTAFKNIPQGECEGQGSERLYSYKESRQEVSGHNNESDAGSATQRLLEGGNCKENQTTQLQEEVEGGAAVCLQNTGGETVVELMETEVVEERSIRAETKTFEENVMKTLERFEAGFVLQEDTKERREDLKEEMFRFEMRDSLCEVDTVFTQKDFNDNTYQDLAFSILDQSSGGVSTVERVAVKEAEDWSAFEKEDPNTDLVEHICEIIQPEVADEHSRTISSEEERITSMLLDESICHSCLEPCTDVIEDEILDLWIQHSSIQSSEVKQEDHIQKESPLELPQEQRVETTSEVITTSAVDASLFTSESGFLDQSLDEGSLHNLETQELPEEDRLMTITCSELQKSTEEQYKYFEVEQSIETSCDDLSRKSSCSSPESPEDDTDVSCSFELEESISSPVTQDNSELSIQTDDAPVKRTLFETETTLFMPDTPTDGSQLLLQEKPKVDALPDVKDEESHETDELDFSPQKSRIAVKNPRARPPKDPRSLLHKPSLEPSPSKPTNLQPRGPAGVPIGGLGFGIKLPGLGAGFPVLKKTTKTVEDKTETATEETTSVRDEDENKPEETPKRPKWMPPNHPSFGNPLMSELKSKLKKTPKE